MTKMWMDWRDGMEEGRGGDINEKEREGVLFMICCCYACLNGVGRGSKLTICIQHCGRYYNKRCCLMGNAIGLLCMPFLVAL